jgi:uncharacterized protein DUF4349
VVTENIPGKWTIAAILGGIAAVVVIGLVLLGGQTSSILSNVGAPIGGGSGGDTTGDPNGEPANDNPAAGQIADGKAAVPEQATQPELLIIRTGQLTIEVGNLDDAVAAARDRVLAVGGYVSSSDQSTDSDQAAAAVRFRIPAARWDDALAAIQGVGAATRSLHVETEAITNQVIDLGARISNLRATEAALQAIMVKATKIPDVLDVQAKLSDVRGEIERLVAEKTHLEEQAAYGTLTVTFVLPAAPAVEEVTAGWDPADDADAASGALIGLGQRLVSLGIWAGIVGVPVAIGLLVVLALAFVAWRLSRRVQSAAGDS